MYTSKKWRSQGDQFLKHNNTFNEPLDLALSFDENGKKKTCSYIQFFSSSSARASDSSHNDFVLNHQLENCSRSSDSERRLLLLYIVHSLFIFFLVCKVIHSKTF